MAPIQSLESPLVDPRQARTVAGVLAMLVRMVGPYTSLGIVLQQARSEVMSLVDSEEARRTKEPIGSLTRTAGMESCATQPWHRIPFPRHSIGGSPFTTQSATHFFGAPRPASTKSMRPSPFRSSRAKSSLDPETRAAKHSRRHCDPSCGTTMVHDSAAAAAADLNRSMLRN